MMDIDVISHIDRNLLLTTERFTRSRAYWRTKLPETYINDALIYSPKSAKSEKSETYLVELPTELSSQILKIAKNADLAVFTIVLTGIQVLLYKYGFGESSSVITPLLQGRISEETLNKYVIIHDMLDSEKSFREALLSAKQNISDVYSHQDYPIEEILMEDGITKEAMPLHLPNIVCEMAELHQPLNDVNLQYELRWSVIREDGRLQLKISFDPAYCPVWWIKQLGDHLVTIYQTSLNDLVSPIAAIQLLNEAESKELIYDFNDNERFFPEKETFISLFRQQVHQTPENIALVYEDTSFSYREVDDISDRLGHYLAQQYHVGHTDNVVVLLERSEWWAISIIALWKLGAVYVPLDIDFPEERIAFITEETASKVVIDHHEIQKFREVAHQDASLNTTLAPTDLAYIIYTSGTTGTPKGVMIEHLGLLNHLYAKINDLGLSADSRVAQNASQCFDISIWQLFSPLLTGGKSYIVPNHCLLDVKSFLNKLNEYEINILEVVPSYLSALLETEEFTSLKGLDHLLVTGEAFKPALLNKCFDISPELSIVNAYGPTEASDDITHMFLNSGSRHLFVPVGKPVQNMNVYVLDQHKAVCPIGVKGEVYVSGIGVGPGYFKDDEKTKKAYMLDHLRSGSKLKMFKTGDVGRYHKNGVLELFGRRDSQVKIRGHRIEIQEVEMAMMKLAISSDIVVIANQENIENVSLTAFMLGVDEHWRQQEKIKRKLQKHLPDYMIPDKVFFIEEVPLTRNGKVDQRALKALEDSFLLKVPDQKSDQITPLQTDLIRLWQDVLGKEVTDIQANLFDLGGHSLTVARLLAKISNELQYSLKPNDVFDNPTIEGLSSLLETREKDQEIPIKPAAPRAYYELSPVQRQIWVAHQLNYTNYNIFRGVEIKGELSFEHLEYALNKLIQTHEVLRTRFITFNGKPHQEILNPAPKFQIELIEETIENSDQLLSELSEHHFHLDKWPLIAATGVRLGKDHYQVILNVHHIILDGWSLAMLTETLLKEYNQLVVGVDKPLPVLEVQYKDYVLWQQGLKESKDYASAMAHWTGEFAQLPIHLDLPTDHQPPSARTYHGETFRFKIDSILREKLEKLAQSTQSTMFMVLMSVLFTQLYRYTGKQQLIVGSPVAGRTRVDLEQMLGLMINVLPIQVSPEKHWSFKSLLKEVKRKLSLGYEYQHFINLSQSDQLNSIQSGEEPLFNVMMVMQNYLNEDQIQINGAKAEEIEVPGKGSKFDLLFEVIELQDEIIIDLEYATDIFKAETIERLVSHFNCIVEEVTNDADQQLNQINYLPVHELQQVKDQFATHRGTKLSDTKISQAYAKVLEAANAEQAVAYGDQQLTYAQLEVLSNNIAAHLSEVLSPDKRNVVVMRHRSVIQPAIMLGIFKAGGCYIPIDPNWPQDRIEYSLRVSDPCIIFVDQHGQELPAQWVSLTKSPEGLADCDRVYPLDWEDPEAPAYMLYTSGSTGKPKGVVQSYRTLENLMNWMLNHANLEYGMSFLQFVSFGFDVSIQDMLFSILSGGRLHILEEEARTDVGSIAATIEKMGIEMISMPYSILSKLVRFMNEHDQCPNRLRHIITAGEQPYLDEQLAFFRERGSFSLHNHFGPTETHVCAAYTLKPDQIEMARTLPVGRPINGATIRILDEFGADTGIGVPGEIFTSGACLFNGYQTDEGISTDNLVQIDGRLWYKSGDLGKWLPDGNIQFLGRKDHQIKINGYRIELGEIETILTQLSQVDQAVVIKKQTGDKEMLCCFIASGETIDETTLREALSRKLPYYMVPEVFIHIEQIPLNSNDKIDLDKLHKYPVEQFSNKLIAPENEEECELLKIWQSILERDQISTSDNFFLIGGQSLKATELMLLASRKFELGLDMKTIFTYPTIRELASFIRENQSKPLETNETHTIRI